MEGLSPILQPSQAPTLPTNVQMNAQEQTIVQAPPSSMNHKDIIGNRLAKPNEIKNVGK